MNSAEWTGRLPDIGNISLQYKYIYIKREVKTYTKYIKNEYLNLYVKVKKSRINIYIYLAYFIIK